MVFEIRAIDKNMSSLTDIFGVCQEAFDSIDFEKLRTNWLKSNEDSLFIGAYDGSKLAAVNGFIAHTVLVRGKRFVAYQSCWSATRKEYRGRGLFSSLINAAKSLLADKGGVFIFGFPNSVSAPIFLRKLGFKEIGMKRVFFTTIGPPRLLAYQLGLAAHYKATASDRLVRFDYHECARWKRFEHSSRLVEVEHNTNFIWGVVSERRFMGASIRLFIAGGCEINKPKLMGHLIRRVGTTSGASLIRFACAEGSMLASSGMVTRSGEKTEPFIYFPLSRELDDCEFDAHVGLKDVY